MNISIKETYSLNSKSRVNFLLRYELGNLIDIVRKKEFPFNKDTIEAYYKKYINLVNK